MVRTGLAILSREFAEGCCANQMVEDAIVGWDVGELDFFFVENVGNLVCPSSYDLGEDVRLVLMSVTEGEDKPAGGPSRDASARGFG